MKEDIVKEIKNILGQFAKDNNSDDALQIWAETIYNKVETKLNQKTILLNE